jgi:hypothetical protein
MRDRCRSVASLRWVPVLVASLFAASCGGQGDEAAVIAAAERAWPMAELWDPRTGDAVAQPASSEALGVAAFDSFIRAEPGRVAHLEMAADMGYPTVNSAGRFTFDNGAVMTVASMVGEREGQAAMLVVGSMPPDDTTPETPEAVFIAVPVFEDGRLVRVDYSSERGAFSLDMSGGEVELTTAEYGSCATWNCLAGAVFFWWQDNMTDVDNPYMDLMGAACSNCVFQPLFAEVACPACVVLIGAPILASLTNCTLWPCDLCVSDSCHPPAYEDQQCVTENGVSVVRRSVTRWVCENPRTQTSECVEGETEVEILDTCPWGCRPGSPTCQFPTQCLVGLQNCPSTYSAAFCSSPTELTTVYETSRCVPSDDPAAGGEWGVCVPGGTEWEPTTCPYDCADGACQPPPTCDPTACEQIERPIGEPSCILRPDDGAWIIQQDFEPHACVTVEPRTPMPTDWPEGRTCQAQEPITRALRECEYGCAEDGVSCAAPPSCSAFGMSPVPVAQDLPEPVAATRQAIVAAAVACDYDTLGALASWPYFAYSFGESGDPAGYWRSLEEGDTGEPLRWMVETLNLPFARVEAEGDVS